MQAHLADRRTEAAVDAAIDLALARACSTAPSPSGLRPPARRAERLLFHPAGRAALAEAAALAGRPSPRRRRRCCRRSRTSARERPRRPTRGPPTPGSSATAGASSAPSRPSTGRTAPSVSRRSWRTSPGTTSPSAFVPPRARTSAWTTRPASASSWTSWPARRRSPWAPGRPSVGRGPSPRSGWRTVQGAARRLPAGAPGPLRPGLRLLLMKEDAERLPRRARGRALPLPGPGVPALRPARRAAHPGAAAARARRHPHGLRPAGDGAHPDPAEAAAVSTAVVPREVPSSPAYRVTYDAVLVEEAVLLAERHLSRGRRRDLPRRARPRLRRPRPRRAGGALRGAARPLVHPARPRPAAARGAGRAARSSCCRTRGCRVLPARLPAGTRWPMCGPRPAPRRTRRPPSWSACARSRCWIRKRLAHAAAPRAPARGRHARPGLRLPEGAAQRRDRTPPS